MTPRSLHLSLGCWSASATSDAFHQLQVPARGPTLPCRAPSLIITRSALYEHRTTSRLIGAGSIYVPRFASPEPNGELRVLIGLIRLSSLSSEPRRTAEGAVRRMTSTPALGGAEEGLVLIRAERLVRPE